MKRSGAARGWLLAAALVAIGAAPADAKIDPSPDSFGIPIERGKPELGAGWDSKESAARAEPGACVEDLGTERSEESSARWSLATLTRANGRLLVGVHVTATRAVETLSSPRLTDAARRLGQSDSAAFRELCGDGFVARVELGAHWLGEIEVDRAAVPRAASVLVTGSWTDPAPFRAALEALARYPVSARELPGGSRAAAIELAMPALIERAASFPDGVSSESSDPFVAVFSGYTQESLSGVALPGASEVDGRAVAERMFRSAQPTAMSNAAYRAAEMRKAQVRRYVPEEAAAAEEAAPIELSNESLPPAPAAAAPPAAQAPAAPADVRESPLRESALRSGASAQVHRQAAFVYEQPNAPVVYATTVAPGGVHAERQRQRFYWVPGAASPTPENERAIRAAMAGAPVRGVTVAIVEVGGAVVVMTDAPPPGAVFSVAAGERRAWIAGVAQPDAAQRAALLEAVRAEGAAQ